MYQHDVTGFPVHCLAVTKVKTGRLTLQIQSIALAQCTLVNQQKNYASPDGQRLSQIPKNASPT
jgi:hypothetical protein